MLGVVFFFFFVQAEGGIRFLVRSRGLVDVYKRQGLLCGFLNPLICSKIFSYVYLALLPDLIHQEIRDTLIKIVAAEMIIPIRSKYLYHAFTNLYNGNVKCSAAQVIPLSLIHI